MWLVEKLVLDWLDLSYPGGIYNRKKAQVKKIQTHMQYNIPFFFFWFRISIHEKAGGLKKKKKKKKKKSRIEKNTHIFCVALHYSVEKATSLPAIIRYRLVDRLRHFFA